MKLSQRWKQTTAANKAMVYTTGIVALGTLFYAGAALWQVHILNKSAEEAAQQNERMIAASERIAATTVGALNEAKRVNEEIANRAERANNAAERFADAASKGADAAKTSANSATSIVKQNERIVRAVERQANASQTTANAAEKTVGLAAQTLAVNTQLIVGYIPKLARLTPNEPMLVDVLFTNKSNFVVSVTGGKTKLVFTQDASIATASFNEIFNDATAIQAFDLAPQSDIVPLHVLSRRLTESEVHDIEIGKLNAFVFIRIAIKGLANPLDGCYSYYATTKGLVQCYKSDK